MACASADGRSALGRIYDEVLCQLDVALGPGTRYASAQQPITTGAEMALGGWDPATSGPS